MQNQSEMNESAAFSDSRVSVKLKAVLNNINQPGFKTSDDTLLHKLHDVFSKRSEDVEELVQVLIAWLETTVVHWPLMENEAKVFALRAASTVSRCPASFHVILAGGTVEKLLEFINESAGHNDFSIKLAAVDLLYSIVQHSEGLDFVVNSGYWKNIISLYHTDNSIYSLNTLRKLLISIIISLHPINLEMARRILFEVAPSQVLEQLPIGFEQIKEPKILEKCQLVQHRHPERRKTLNGANLWSGLIIEMLSANIPKDRIKELIEQCRVETWAWNELHNSVDEETINAASRVLCSYNMLHIVHVGPGLVGAESAIVFHSAIVSHLYLFINRHMFFSLLDACVEYQKLWQKFGCEVISEESENVVITGKPSQEDISTKQYLRYRIQNFLVVCQVLPILVFVKRPSEDEYSSVLDVFVDKVFKMCSLSTVRFAYYYRTQIFKVMPAVIEKLGPHSINGLIHLSAIFKREQAILVFQSLSHILKEFVASTMKPYDRKNIFYNMDDCPNLFIMLINAFSCYLSKFNFTWTESLETSCTLAMLQTLLVHPGTPPSVCVDILKVIKLVLLRFMPPNLALLVDTLQGSSMSDLGKQLYKTLHSPHWEIRDSTIEVLEAISSLAEAKFPAFQTLLLDNTFPQIIIALMESEHEPYARASAASCIREMVKTQALWSTLSNRGVIEKLLIILHFDTEGIVRCQAALAIQEAYKQSIIPIAIIESVYDTMHHVTQNDLHWEVKFNCLSFWDSAIDQSLAEQGMLDGTFPQVLFSKEKKKIISLTPEERSSRVYQALKKLSRIGCLQVLWETIHNECDLEVQKKAFKLIERIISLVDKYDLLSATLPTIEVNPIGELTPLSVDLGFCEDLLPSSENNSEEDNLELNLSTLLPTTADEVIEQITNEGDLQLLPHLLTKPQPPPSLPKIKRVVFPVKEFIYECKLVDLNRIIQSKIKWATDTHEGIESLLDDMLLTAEGPSVIDKNAIDCY